MTLDEHHSDALSRLTALEAMFAEVVRMPPGGPRETRIAELCRGDAALELDLRRLLAAHEARGGFMAEPTAGSEPDADAADRRESGD